MRLYLSSFLNNSVSKLYEVDVYVHALFSSEKFIDFYMHQT